MEKDQAQRTDNTSEQLGDLSAKVEETVRTIFEATRTAASRALKTSAETFEDSEELVQAGVQRSLTLVRKYPLESAVACLGIGFVVGKLLSNKK